MKTRIIEATTGSTGNHGKFLVGAFDVEWGWRSEIKDDGSPLLVHEGWSDGHVLVTDLATGEGALFRLGGHAPADLQKHRVWVCPLFEPFLSWLYRFWAGWNEDILATADTSKPGHNLDRVYSAHRFLDALPDLVPLTFDEAPFSMTGYRRRGPEGEIVEAAVEVMREWDALGPTGTNDTITAHARLRQALRAMWLT